MAKIVAQLVFAAIFSAYASLANAEEVDLELVLLADASGSIDQSEIEFQRQGYAEAITDPDVLDAIKNTAYGSIAVIYVEWAGNQAIVADWTRISNTAEAEDFAARVVEPPRLAQGFNAIGAALLKGLELIENNEFEGWRRVIDFSGDSVRNFSGPSIAEAREMVLEAGITINALPILKPNDPGRVHCGLEAAYEEQIIGGPGAFLANH